MADYTPKYDPAIALDVPNLQSLADGSRWQSDSRDNDVDNGMSVDVYVTIGTTTSAGNSSGYVDVWIASSADGVAFTGNASGTEGAYSPAVSTEDRNLTRLGRMPVDASEATARTFRHRFRAELPPRAYSVILENGTGQALAASGNAVSVQPIKFTDS